MCIGFDIHAAFFVYLPSKCAPSGQEDGSLSIAKAFIKISLLTANRIRFPFLLEICWVAGLLGRFCSPVWNWNNSNEITDSTRCYLRSGDFWRECLPGDARYVRFRAFSGNNKIIERPGRRNYAARTNPYSKVNTDRTKRKQHEFRGHLTTNYTAATNN